MKQRLLVAALGLGFLASPVFAADDINIPCRTAKLVVPWGAGGGTDIVFRTIVEEANAQGAVPKLQVVNMPGRSGNKGTAKFLKARANGCELLAVHQSIITSYLAGQSKSSWEAVQPVARLTETAEFIGVNGQQPYNTLSELQTYAKANPEKVVAVGSLGSTSHYLMLMMEDALGIKLRHVSYDGTRERTTALLAGNAHVGLANFTASKSNVESGDLKFIATTASKRSQDAKNVPTFLEQGFDVDFGVRRGIALPKGTDAKIVAHYEEVFRKAINSPTVQKSLAAKGIESTFLNSEEYSNELAQEFVVWEALAKKVGIYNAKS